MTTTPFGKQLRDARASARISQEELAARIGRSQGYVSAIERGAQEPSDTQANELLVACGVPALSSRGMLERHIAVWESKVRQARETIAVCEVLIPKLHEALAELGARAEAGAGPEDEQP